MEAFVGVDQTDDRCIGPTLSAVNHSQFHEVTVPSRDQRTIAATCESANPSFRIGSFPKGNPIANDDGAKPVSKHARLGREPDRAEGEHGAREHAECNQPSRPTSPRPGDAEAPEERRGLQE